MRNLTRHERAGLIFTAALLALSGLLALICRRAGEEGRMPPRHLRCVMDLSRMKDTSTALVAGYNYFLVSKYAADNGHSVDIVLANSADTSYIDSLRRGSIDLVVLPYSGSPAIDSVLVSDPVDNMSVWLVRHGEGEHLRDINAWSALWRQDSTYTEVRDSYLRRFDAFRSRKRSRLSPYDELIRESADSLGWDWRMLAALIYSESRFNISAESRRGAKGLMQMMPRTAAHYGVTNCLDPEMNIRAGARLLSDLIRRYYKAGDNMTERYKYALAAYNAGIGRIDDVIRFARHRGVDTSYWDNVAAVIPEMTEDNVNASGVVRLGPFKGVETIAYVDKVFAAYQRFLVICPGTPEAERRPQSGTSPSPREAE